MILRRAPLYVSFVDWSLTLTGRLLSPLFALALVHAFVGFVPGEAGTGGSRIVRAGFTVLLVTLSLFFAARVIRLAGASRLEGLDYSLTRLEDSALIERIRELPEEAMLYSNSVERIYYLSGRAVRTTPWVINKYSRQENPSYEIELEGMRDAIEEEGAVLVYFYNQENYFTPPLEDLVGQLQLERLAVGVEGEILRAAN